MGGGKYYVSFFWIYSATRQVRTADSGSEREHDEEYTCVWNVGSFSSRVNREKDKS